MDFKHARLSSGLITFNVPIKQNFLVVVVADADYRSARIAEVEVGPVGGPCPPRLQARPPDLPVHTPRATCVGNKDEAAHH